MPTYYQFGGSTGQRVVVTDDREGKNLPPREFGEWVFKREVDFTPGKQGTYPVSHDDVIKDVTTNGYFEWPPEK